MQTTASAAQPASTAAPPNHPFCPHSQRLPGIETTRSPQRPCDLYAHDPTKWVARRHAVASAGVTLLGSGILLSRKGTTAHRVAGRVWAGAAIITNLNSFRMRDSLGHLTWFHAASTTALGSTVAGVYYVRSRNIAKHTSLIGLAVAATALAGAAAWTTPNKRANF